MSQNIKYQLYGLFCPMSNEMKYIGITKNGLNKRLSSHLRNPTNFLTKRWFDNLKNLGVKPEIKLIKECENYKDLLKNEIEEIKKYRNKGFELYNISDGGDLNPMLGKTHSEEARKKISLTHKGRKVSEEQKLKQKEFLKKLWNNPEWSEKVRKKMGYNTKGDKNPNWRGGKTNIICECGNKKGNYSLNCRECRDIKGEKNGFYGKKHKKETIDILKQKSMKFGEKNPNFKYDISKEDLYNLYIVENKTVVNISIKFNCSINTINKKLRQFNIFKPKSNIYNLVVNDIKKYINDGLNYIQIGNIYGCSNKIIHKFVKKHNLYVKQ